MASTFLTGSDEVQQVRDDYGESGLSDTQIENVISLAERYTEKHWEETIREESDKPDEDLEKIALLLVEHIMQDKEPQVQSDSVQDKSVTFTIPNGELDSWLRNTTEGRTLGSFLTLFGISPVTTSRTKPRTFR